MSKIQDALKKIQGENPKPRPGDDTDTLPVMTDTVVLAKLVEGGGDGALEDANGKVLHVDPDALRQAGFIAPHYHEQLLANQYRDIKRPLIAHAFGKRATRIEGGSIIMVSSALSGEGKTFTCINLALSMARERDHSVLLVDADVAKPQTSEMFGTEREEGLLDALEDPSRSVRSLVLATDVDGLSVLPAGKPRLHATELLASTAMERICDTLSGLSEGQIVLFDSPPILQTSEAKVLAGLAGQIVVVVRAEQTPRDAVANAVSMLDQDKAINLVLNQARVGARSDSYGYGYGYADFASES